MKRGEIWIASGSGYAGKPRPVLIVQSDSVTAFDSTVVCLVTSNDSKGVPTRVAIRPSSGNGLERESWVMTEKLYAFRSDQLMKKIGELGDHEMFEVSEQLKRVLGI